MFECLALCFGTTWTDPHVALIQLRIPPWPLVRPLSPIMVHSPQFLTDKDFTPFHNLQMSMTPVNHRKIRPSHPEHLLILKAITPRSGSFTSSAIHADASLWTHIGIPKPTLDTHTNREAIHRKYLCAIAVCCTNVQNKQIHRPFPPWGTELFSVLQFSQGIAQSEPNELVL